MIIERYIIRQILMPMLAICSVLLFVFACYMAARYWAHALSGSLSSSVVVKLIAYRSVVALELLLPVTLYLAVILALSRFIRQMELTAMYSCGIGPGTVIRAVMLLSTAVAVAVAAISLQIRPLAWQKFFRLKAQAKSSFDLSRMNSGIFYEIWDGKRVIFAQEVNRRKSRASGVFIRTEGQDTVQVVYARSAVQMPRKIEGSPVLVLEDGREYEFSKRGEDDFILNFRRSKMLLEPRRIQPEQKMKAVSSATLFESQDREGRAELQWRLVMPLSTLVLSLTGIGMALRFTAPRGTRNSSLVAGLVLFACYYNLLALLKKWISNGTISPVPGLWAAPVFLLAAAVILLAPETGLQTALRKARGFK